MLILVVRHADNILTIYTNIDNIKVAKGDKVKRGQSIAAVRAETPAFLHFEVRNGADAVDPMPYLE
jgi:murein DD-endopeptidase MepM/ murein hydrolase activator NlpD